MIRNRHCVVKTCQNFKGTSDKNIRMFRFPKDLGRKKCWTEIIQKINGSKYQGGYGYVCFTHFSDSQFDPSSHQAKLKDNSLPDLIFDSNEQYEIEQDRNENETIDSLNKEIRNLKLSHDVELLKQHGNLKVKQQMIDLLEEQVRDLGRESEELKRTIRSYGEHEMLDLGPKSSNIGIDLKVLLNCFINGVKTNHKYPEIVREFCICLHYHSPRAYEFVRQIFNDNLPGVSTIRSWYSNSCSNSGVGISDSCLNILKRKAEQQKSENRKLLCSLVFDEMHIRQHTQWNNSSKQFLGFSTYGKNHGISKQALVFMACGLNDNFKLPIAFHFIHLIDAVEKKNLLLDILDALSEIGVTVTNITFDGHATNIAMCKSLGANLDVDSENFKPFFEIQSGHQIFIWYDPCHMLKLVRNAIGSKQVMVDSEGKSIHWDHYVKLVEMSKTNGIDLTHKMSNKHLNWKRRIMKVDLAAQTLSASTADAIDILKENNVIGFQNATGTVIFTRFFNSLFDIFNSKSDEQINFKRALCSDNEAEIFDFCQKGIEYIKGLTFTDNNQVQLVYKSKIKTAFVGFIINFRSLCMFYNKYVDELGVLKSIKTYSLCQDFIEIFFGKIRSLGGYNDNPTHEQFVSAVRKLVVNETIMVSKHGNCLPVDITTKPFSDILFITSRKMKIDHNDYNILPTNAEMDALMEKLGEIERLEKNDLVEYAKDFNISFVAQVIERKLMDSDKKSCSVCSNIFVENEKVPEARITQKYTNKPCVGTFKICKAADRFLKIELLSEKTSFTIFYHAISDLLFVKELFPATDFAHNGDHLFYIVRLIIDAYIHIKCTYIARSITLDNQKKVLRTKLHKLIHAYGQ